MRGYADVKMPEFCKTLTALAVLLGSVAALADISAELGMCTNCHGEDGLGGDTKVPVIAGMPAIVQEDALFAYIDGDRSCGDSPLMCNIVSRLTDDQVTELAKHYAAMAFAPANEDFDTAMAEKGKSIHEADCMICHGTSPADADSSILHGQRKGYLGFVLQQYAAGERAQLPAMENKMSSLSTDDIEALVNYYASYRE